MANGTDDSTRGHEHRQDREHLRSRERARRVADEQDRETFRQRDQRRYKRGGGQQPVGGIGHALVRAGARAYIGTTSAIGGLILNLADSYYMNPYWTTYVDDVQDDDRDTSDRGRSPRRRVGGYFSDFYDDVGAALEEAADALADSADEFVRERRDVRDRNGDADEEIAPREERSKRRRGSSESDDLPPAAKA